MESAVDARRIKIEPNEDNQPEHSWEVSWVPSVGVSALSCARCNFLGLPQTLRLHQLLGCCSKVNTSGQSKQQSYKCLLPETQCSVQLERLPCCNPCGFIAPSRTLRLHQLLGCCAIVQKAEKSKPLHQKSNNLINESVISPKKSPSEKKTFSCNICNYTCRFLAYFKRHTLIHTGEKPYSCNVCSFKCNNNGSLKRHALTHTREKPFSCTICDYKCSIKYNLQSHILTHTENKEKPFTCTICNCKFSEKKNLKSHTLTHTSKKLLSCNTCDYTCSLKGRLKEHNLIHTGEKPFCCKICSYKCNTKSRLKSHNLIHTGEKPFSCKVCAYKFNLLGNLKKHILHYHHEVKAI